MSSSWMQATAPRLGLTGADPATALATHISRELPALLAVAPARAVELLNRLADGPIGLLPHPQQDNHAAPQFLIEAGVLVPLDERHVELPREAGLALRSGRIIEHLDQEPWPDPGHTATGATVSTAQRDNAALSTISETLRNVGLALEAIRSRPVSTLRSGGIGVRALRLLASAAAMEPEHAGFVLELAAAADLVRLDPDTSHWQLTGQGLGWPELPREEQWLRLAQAWLGLDRAISLIGEPQPAEHEHNSAHRAISPLAAEAKRADMPRLRRLLFDRLMSIPEQREAQRTRIPAADCETLYTAAGWYRPRLWRRLGRLAPDVLDEAEALGLTGAGAVTTQARLLLQDEPEAAARVLAAALPAAVDKILLQNDLTAVAPGYLDPELAAELSRMADREGQGPAVIYRFSDASLRRAFDAGREPEQLLSFLTESSSTAVPQALDYLIRDAAARHGSVRVFAAGSVLAITDEAVLTTLLHDTDFAPLGFRTLGPELLSSTAPPAEIARLLREKGIAPLVEQASASTQEAARRTVYDVTNGPGSVPTRQAAPLPEEQLRVLRQGTAAQQTALAPQLTVEALYEAARSRQPVLMTTVDASGNPARAEFVVLSVSGGRARIYDANRESERVVSLHRIIDVEPPGPGPG